MPLLSAMRGPSRRRTAVISLAALAVVLALTATLRIATIDLASRPRPMSEYASAAAETSRRQSVDARVAVATGGSIFLGHGHRTPTAVVLLHGYTNSPLQYDSLGRLLYRAGDNVYIPRLPRHAVRINGAAALSRLTAEELRAAADSAVDVAAGLGDSIVVVGLSMGGTMTAWIAQHRSNVRRVILVAPLMGIARVPSRLEGPLANLAIRVPNVGTSKPDAQQSDREIGWSSRTVAQILQLGMAVQRASVDTPPATRDMAILLNGNDHTNSTRPVLEVARRWRAHGATVHEYELSKALGLPHDVIDPRQPVRQPEVVYPAIAAMITGRSPEGDDIKDIFIKGANSHKARTPMRREVP
jgi:esterase/lipase